MGATLIVDDDLCFNPSDILKEVLPKVFHWQKGAEILERVLEELTGYQ